MNEGSAPSLNQMLGSLKPWTKRSVALVMAITILPPALFLIVLIPKQATGVVAGGLMGLGFLQLFLFWYTAPGTSRQRGDSSLSVAVSCFFGAAFVLVLEESLLIESLSSAGPVVLLTTVQASVVGVGVLVHEWLHGEDEPHPFSFIDIDRFVLWRGAVLRPQLLMVFVVGALVSAAFLHGVVSGGLSLLLLTLGMLAVLQYMCLWSTVRRARGASLLLPGITLFVTTVSYQLLGLWDLVPLLGGLHLVGITGLALSLTMFTARRVFDITADNARKSQELSEARRIQLSLLPEVTPVLVSANIAWRMETATEVGGDYYDYSLTDSGTLTLALGDATGHGMDSGVVVTGTKSLFQTFADAPSITDSLTVMSKSLKGMNLPQMGMAMILLRVEDSTYTVSSAGMPPVLIYRSTTGEISEILIAGYPLGISRNAKYKQETFEMSSGDVILMMSDGLPERMNQEEELLGYPRVQEMFRGVAEMTPEEICSRMLQGGEGWAAGRPQDDDITLVALQVK